MATLPARVTHPRCRPSLPGIAGPWLLIAVLMAALGLSPTARAETSVYIYAAASLGDALDAAIARYEARRGVDIVPIYAASSTAARQIANGAPAELYFSANERWMDWLGEQGITLTGRGDLLHNQLVLIAPRDGDTRPITLGAKNALAARLGDGRRLAVGDPAHVPAGIYAKQALQSLGEWQALKPRLARADNVRAALALVATGAVPYGIVYRTDAHAEPRAHLRGLFPKDSHPPIVYPGAATLDAQSEAHAFLGFLMTEAAQAVFDEAGFQRADPE